MGLSTPDANNMICNAFSIISIIFSNADALRVYKQKKGNKIFRKYLSFCSRRSYNFRDDFHGGDEVLHTKSQVVKY